MATVKGGNSSGPSNVSILSVNSEDVQQVNTRQNRTAIQVTPVVSTSPAYASGDAVGGLMTFSNAARFSGATIVIESVIVVDKSKQAPALVLQLFDRSVTVASDNAAADWSDSDILFGFAPIQLSNWETNASNSICGRVVNMPVKLNGTDLYGQFLTRGTPTFVGTSDIVVWLVIAQD